MNRQCNDTQLAFVSWGNVPSVSAQMELAVRGSWIGEDLKTHRSHIFWPLHLRKVNINTVCPDPKSTVPMSNIWSNVTVTEKAIKRNTAYKGTCHRHTRSLHLTKRMDIKVSNIHTKEQRPKGTNARLRMNKCVKPWMRGVGWLTDWRVGMGWVSESELASYVKKMLEGCPVDIDIG